jgi:signal transduction histidine kinase
MRSVPRHFAFGVPRGARRVAPLEAFSRTEKIIAFCRVLLATATLAIVVVDPKQPSFVPPVGYVVLTAYVAYSALLFLLVRGEHLRKDLVGPYSAGADVLWVTLITVFTEGGTSPFFLLHAFVIFSVSVRWGFVATMAVTVVLALLYPVALHLASYWAEAGDLSTRRAQLFRPIYLLVLGYLVGYLGEHERHSKRKLGFMLELPAAFRRSRPPGRAIGRLMGRVLEHFGAERGLLVLRDPESGRYFTWDMARHAGRTRLGLRITEADPLPQPFAAPTEGFLANDLRPREGSALCYDVLTGQIARKPIAAGLALPEGVRAQAVLAAPVLIQRESRGHALVVRESAKFTRDDLEFLLLLVGQAAAGFENVRLQEKAEEVAVLEERTRIARDLHDGFIQSLAGIDLRVEACQRLLQRDPGRVRRELEELHQAVDRGYREVRHYLTVLRAARRQTDDFWAALDDLVAEFSTRERLTLQLEHPRIPPSLSPQTGYELVQIVREALRNAVRHGKATQAVVKVGCRPSHVYLVIRDNGCGFERANGSIDADGYLAASATPWSIRERAAALGGVLRVWTQPGRGTEVSLTFPAGPRNGRHGSDRRIPA